MQCIQHPACCAVGHGSRCDAGHTLGGSCWRAAEVARQDILQRVTGSGSISTPTAKICPYKMLHGAGMFWQAMLAYIARCKCVYTIDLTGIHSDATTLQRVRRQLCKQTWATVQLSRSESKSAQSAPQGAAQRMRSSCKHRTSCRAGYQLSWLC
jgi:hypothetical protein